jgi:hypothetical protein
MSSSTNVRLTSGQRLGRGLRYTALGPVDVTRGVVGLGISGAHSSASWVGERYRRGRLREQLASVQETIGDEIAAAQQVVANLPQALQDARGGRSRARRRRLLLVAAGVTVLAGGAVAFSVIRRSARPEEPPVRPPSVEVAQRP